MRFAPHAPCTHSPAQNSPVQQYCSCPATGTATVVQKLVLQAGDWLIASSLTSMRWRIARCRRSHAIEASTNTLRLPPLPPPPWHISSQAATCRPAGEAEGYFAGGDRGAGAEGRWASGEWRAAGAGQGSGWAGAGAAAARPRSPAAGPPGGRAGGRAHGGAPHCRRGNHQCLLRGRKLDKMKLAPSWLAGWGAGWRRERSTR